MAKKRQKRIHQQQYAKPSLQNKLTAQTPGQKEYIRTIVENKITFCVGPAGSGKSYCATGIACQKLMNDDDETKKIIITRPIVGLGRKSMGSLPGDIEEKMKPYIEPVEKHLIHFLGQSNYLKFKNENRIIIAPLEYMRGATFDDSFVLLDEAQNADYKELVMFATRFGKNSTMVLNGDIEQTDLDYYDDEENDFARLIRWFSGVNGFGASVLENSDIVREEIVALFLTVVQQKQKQERFKG